MHALFVPLQRPFAQHIKETQQKDGYKQQNGGKTRKAHFAKIDSIRVKKDHFHVEKDEKDGRHKILDGNWHTRIPLRFNAAFKIFVLVFSASGRAENVRDHQNEHHEANGHQ